MIRTASQFPRQVTESPDLGIVMPDGVRLSARVWMPADAPWFAGHGFAATVPDMHGSGVSQDLLADEYSEPTSATG